MARNPKVELRGHEGQVVHPITDGDCVIFPNGETLSHKLSEQEEVMYAPEVTNSSPMFKVGEGDSSDYSANVLDGAYQEAVLKGQTYVNTIQEPSADVITLPTPFTEYERTQSKTFTEMQDGTFGLNLVGQSYVNCIQEPSEPSYVALGENLEFQNKKVEYTTDGQVKSAMLNGMTLVNLATTTSFSMTAEGTWSRFVGGMTLTPNTYTVIADIEVLGTGACFIGFYEYYGNTRKNTKYFSKSGKYIWTENITNPNIASYGFYVNDVTTDVTYKLNNLVILEGDHTQEDIPYFEGMQSVTMTTELENVCSRYNSSVAKNGKTFTTSGGRNLYLARVSEISKFNFKQNTKYLIQFKISNLNLDGLDSIELVFSDASIAKGDALFGDTARTNIAQNGIYRIVLTTSNIVSTSAFVVKGQAGQWEDSTSTSRSLTISQIMCIEYQNGMENWDLPYFETTQLMKPLKVQSVNKNLFNINDIPSSISGAKVNVTNSNGTITVTSKSNEGACYTTLTNYANIKLKKGVNYRLSCNYTTNNSDANITLVDVVTGIALDRSDNGSNSTMIRHTYCPSEDVVVCLRFYAAIGSNGKNGGVTTYTNIQVEEGSISTDYIPHQSKTTSALEPITLRAIGDVKDTLDLSTGEYVQRIGEVVLDGSEEWKKDTTEGGTKDNTVIFHTVANFNGFKPSPDVASRNSMEICDKFPVKGNVYNLDEEGIMINNDACLYIRINKTRLSSETVDAFKTYLASNQIKVQSHLANPITRKISLEYPNLQTYTDITHVQSIAMGGTLTPNIYLPSDISYKAMLKPNTSYNVIVDREVIDSTNQLTVNLGGTTANITANRTLITTPSTLSNETLTFSGKDNRLAKAMLIEGSTLISDDLPHFDGIGDVKLGRVVENLCMSNDYAVGSATTTDTYASDNITAKVTIAGSRLYCFKLIKQLENGKKYFIYCPNNNTNNSMKVCFQETYNDSSFYSRQADVLNNNKYRIITIEQKNNPYECLTIGNYGTIPVDTTMTIRRPILCEYIDGMENWDWESIGYFTGTKNIGNEFMRIGNKNLVQNEEALRKANLAQVNVTDVSRLDVKPNTSYYVGLTLQNGIQPNTDYFAVEYKDINGYVVKASYHNRIISFTEEQAKKIKYVDIFTNKEHGESNVYVDHFWIEEASSATSYVAHKHNSLHILPNEQIPLTFEQGAIIFSTTTSFAEQINNTMTTRIRTGLLDLEPNETYRISFGDKNYICGIAFYDNSNIGLNAVSEISNDYVFTTTKDVHKICINIAKSDMDENITPSVLHQVRLEKVTDVTLRSVGDVKDELDLTRGVYIQRIGEVVFNGSENWEESYTTTNHKTYRLMLPQKYNYVDQWRNIGLINDKTFSQVGWFFIYNEQEKTDGQVYGVGDDNKIYIRIKSTDVSSFKMWLQQNPITVQYVLATPIEHKINIQMKNELNQTIAKPNGIFTLPLMYSETNHVDINSQIYPKVQSRDYISYPVIANNSQVHTVFHNKVGTGNLTVNLCGTSVTSVDGTSKCTITTPSTISQYELRLSGARNKVSNVCVFSGDYMNVDVPYVQGMMNAVNPIVKNVGKNLLPNDGYYLKDVYSYNKDGVEFHNSANRAWCAFFYKNISIPMRKGTYIFYIKLISGTHNGGREARLLFSDGTSRDGLWNYNDGTINMHTITLTSDKILIGVEMWNVQGNGIFQLYLGETPTPSQYEPYKENICEPENGIIKLTQDMFEQGTMSGVNGAEYDKAASNARIRTKELIKIKSSTSYIFRMNDNYSVWIKEFNTEGKQSTASVVAWLNNGIFTTKENTEYISFIISKCTNNTSISVSEFDNINPYLCELDKEIHLRSLPNGVRDELNLETGEYIQRIGEIVLDGNIDPSLIVRIDKRGQAIENRIAINTKVLIDEPTMMQDWASASVPKKFVTNRLINDTDNAYYGGLPNTVAKSHDTIHISINTDLLETETKDGIIKYLSKNPIIFIGELKTPIVKQVDINNFPHSYKDGHVVIESNDPSTNVTAQMTYQCVANRTGQIQEHTEQIEKQEHEINELEMLILENIRQQQNR